MKFRLYREYGALNSSPIFNAFEQGIKKLGYTISSDDDAIPVIWSVLWHGRMAPNRAIYDQRRLKQLPIIIIEIGNLIRGITWRISLDHVNRLGNFGIGDYDYDRPKKLGIALKNRQNNNGKILIACQHQYSEQWPKNKTIQQWVNETVLDLKKYTDRKISVRPHPRFPVSLTPNNFVVEKPIRIPNTYDDFNIDYGYHCVVNYNAGPGVQSLIQGTPIICHESSLAYPLTSVIQEIETANIKDRHNWLIDITHKEWTVNEIAEGIPLQRLVQGLSK